MARRRHLDARARSRSRRGALALAVGVLACASQADARPSRRDRAPEPSAKVDGPIARVLAERAEVRSGPGFDYRVIGSVARDDTVRMVERGKRGGWTRVQMESGIVGWILTEQIVLLSTGTGEPEKIGPMRRFGRKLREHVLGPPNLLTARIGGAISAGALGNEGLVLVRPSVFIAPSAAIEAYVGPAVGRDTSRGLMGLAGNLYLSPGIPFTPFISVGMGAVYTKGKADTIASARWNYLLSPGGGIWIIFKRGIGIRFDFRNHVLFRADHASSKQEYSGALAFSF